MIELGEERERIIEIVKTQGPITGERMADKLNLTIIQANLAILTM